jgi:hypothetical protein
MQAAQIPIAIGTTAQAKPALPMLYATALKKFL